MDHIPPGGTIGILGGGQLGRMTALAAANLGYKTVIFSDSENSPAAQVAARTIVASYHDTDALQDFMQAADVISYEFENIPIYSAEFIGKFGRLAPSASVLDISQDRFKEKSFFQNNDLATAGFALIESSSDVESACQQVGLPCVMKTTRLGYDGKGQRMVNSLDEAKVAYDDLGQGTVIVEQFIHFDTEISVIVARSRDGQSVNYPPVHNIHENHILKKTIAPADLDAAVHDQAVEMAIKLTERLDVCGLLAVEMFVTKDNGVLINEMAPRPHNSGHWTMDGCVTSQFEQFVRAICGLPLGSVDLVAPTEMENLLGDEINTWSDILKEKNAHFHHYGKTEARPGRKMGHVNRVKL